MSVIEVARVWRHRRERAQKAGYSPKKASSSQRHAAWIRSAVDNPFQSEDAFRLRLRMALRGER